MESYRFINKRLVEEVQTLRENNAVLEKLLTTARVEMLHERTLRVEQQQMFIGLLKKNFREMAQLINADTDFNNSWLTYRETNSQGISKPRPSSGEILENFRESSKGLRRSTVTVSPIPKRRTTRSKSTSEEPSVYEVDSDEENENREESPSKNTAIEIKDKIEDKLEQSEDVDYIETARNAQIIEDIKQITNDTERLQVLTEEEEEEEDISIKTSLTATIYNTKSEEIVLRNTTISRCESMMITLPLTFPHPNDSHLATSTPRQFCDESKIVQKLDDDTSELQISSRPRRKCAPRELKERSLMEKLRNESCYKTRGKKSNKQKLKK